MKKLLSIVRPYLLKLLIIPPIAAGAILLFLAISNRTGPEKIPEKELSRTLRVVSVKPMVFVPRAAGLGTARPTKVWQAIAEAKGRITEIDPNLEAGSFVKKDTVLVRIDDTDTKLAIQKLNAEIARVKSSVSELEANQKNFGESLKLERQAVQVAENELERNLRLARQNASSQAEVDALQRALLAQKQKVQSIVNSLNLLPSQLEAANANLAVAEASLAERQRDLGRVTIKAPFDCRIGPVQLELNQFVGTGTTLFEAQSTEQIEVEAQVAVRNMRPLFNEKLRQEDVAKGRKDLSQAAVKRYFDVDVTVRYSAGNDRIERVAEFDRIREELESQTRTMGVIVVIDRPFASLVDGPPPVSGTFCEVELRGEPQEARIVIPRSSIHQNDVYTIDVDNRLQRRRVVVTTMQSEFAVIENGLVAGDRLVVSDPTPAVVGMLVKPVVDESLMESIRAQAGGEGTLR